MQDDPHAWLRLMSDESDWQAVVNRLCFVESACDTVAPAGSPADARVHNCVRCEACFATQRALESHCRAKHGDRLEVRRYVASSVCQCCGVDFRQRFRCLLHLSSRRRPQCHEWVIANCSPMSDSDVALFDEDMRVHRCAVQRAGAKS